MTNTIEWKDSEGKYAVKFTGDSFKATRYGEEWRDLCGDGLILAMLFEIDRLDEELTAAIECIENSGVDWAEIREGMDE